MGAWLPKWFGGDSSKRRDAADSDTVLPLIVGVFGLSCLYQFTRAFWLQPYKATAYQIIREARLIEGIYESTDGRDEESRQAEIDFTAILLYMDHKKISKSQSYCFRPDMAQEREIKSLIPYLGYYDIAFEDSPNQRCQEVKDRLRENVDKVCFAMGVVKDVKRAWIA